MTAYSFFEKHRRVKQLLMSVVFIFVLVGSWFYSLLGFFIPACMVFGILIALKQGRQWCDWKCPRGSFWDYMVKPLSPKREIPAVLKSMPVRLGALGILMTIMVIQIIVRWPSASKIGAFFALMLTATTVIGVILAFFYHQRSWCFLCPIGTLSNLVGRNKHMLEINSEQCVECKLCAKVCPVGIKPYIYKREDRQLVEDFDCLKCGSCVAACPKKALKFTP
jgi:ferredoxin-type protein NapH